MGRLQLYFLAVSFIILTTSSFIFPGFITDTIAPLNAKIEAEFNRKLFYPTKRRITKVSLNIDELLRADMDSTANYYNKMLGVGAFTPNEIRRKLGQPEVKGGDQSFRPINFMPLDVKVTQNTKIDKQIDVEEDKDNKENINDDK